MLPNIRSNGPLHQKIAMNRRCQFCKVFALESQKGHRAMPGYAVSGLVPLLELWPEFIRQQQVSEGAALLSERCEVADRLVLRRRPHACTVFVQRRLPQAPNALPLSRDRRISNSVRTESNVGATSPPLVGCKRWLDRQPD